MLAFVMEELREWRERRMRKSVVATVLLLAAVSAVSVLQPLALALAATGAFIVLGWTEGNRYQSSLSSRRILLSFPLSSRAIAAGKAISALAVLAFVALAAAPLLALSAIAWGVRPSAAAACVLSWIACYYATLCAGFASSLVFPGSDGLPGAFIAALWLASSAFLKQLAPSNPFAQVLAILKDESGRGYFLGMGATVLVATAVLAAASIAISAIRRRQHGR